MTEESKQNDVRETLVDDGTGEIFFWIPEGSKEVPTFLIGVADGGGYSSVLMSKDCWEKMKSKMDALLSEHVL